MALNTIQGLYDLEDLAGNIPAVTQAAYDRKLLRLRDALLVYDKFGQSRPLKQRSGKSMVFRRWKKLAENLVPLTEGVTPSGKKLEKEEVVATIKQYGDFLELTDMIEWTNLDPIVTEAVEKLGEQMLESLDSVYCNLLMAGTNGYICTQDCGAAGSTTPTYAAYSANRTSVDGVLTKQLLDKAINVLDRNNAKKFTSQINATDKVSTYPVAASYIAIIHPDIERDLRSKYSGLTFGEEFTPVERYSAQQSIYAGEIGRYRSVRFISTTHCKIWEGSASVGGAYNPGSVVTYRSTDSSHCDVYGVLVLAQDAYGIVPLEGGSARSIIKPPVDPLNQVKTIGWKAATTLAILNDAYMVRLEVASLI